MTGVMSGADGLLLAAVVVALAFVAAAIASAALRLRLSRAAPTLTRTNVRGIEVPVVLGDALVAGAMTGLAVLVTVSLQAREVAGETIAIAIAMVVMWAAGAWDDRKGDESARGFKGHLGALRSRAVTGGLVKIGAGVVAGAAAAPFLPTRGASPGVHVVETVALVALTANLVNLFDRAPGRAGKIALMGLIPLALWGDAQWAISAAPVAGALVLCLVHDLAERAMLGDAGANPLGAALGVGLAASLGESGRVVAIAVLLAMTLASERWSFSTAIQATPALRWFDMLGRRRDEVASK